MQSETFMYDTASVATLTLSSERGAPGVGCHALVLNATLSMERVEVGGTRPYYELTELRTTARTGAGVVCVFAPTIGPWQTRADRQNAYPISLRGLLSRDQVRVLDDLRDVDGGLGLTVDVQAFVHGYAGTRVPQATLQVQLSQSDWLRILDEMAWEERVTFEVAIAGGAAGPPFEATAKHLRDALKQLEHHQWGAALAACRHALEELDTAAGLTGPAKAEWNDKPKREGWDIATRMAFVREAIRHLTHPGAHGTDPGEHTARFATHVVAAIVRDAQRRAASSV